MSNLRPQQNLRRVFGSRFAHFCHCLPAGGGWSLAETQQPFFQGRKTLIVLDDCAALKDVKGRTGQLVSFGYSTPHAGISVWVLTQQITSFAKTFRENRGRPSSVLYPVTQNHEKYLWGLSWQALSRRVQGTDAELKKEQFTYLVFALHHPFRIKIFS